MTEDDKNDLQESGKDEKDFSDRLRYLRNSKGVSAREMSIALGQNVNYINLIENGKRFPSLHGFFMLCDYLELSPFQFFKPENSEIGNFKENGKKNLSKKVELAEILASLSDEQTNSILHLIKAFSK